MEQQISNLKRELEKIGIHTEQELAEAIRNLPPLSLYIMTADIQIKKGEPDNVQKKR